MSMSKNVETSNEWLPMPCAIFFPCACDVSVLFKNREPKIVEPLPSRWEGEIILEERWWGLYRQCVGFSLHCPPSLEFSGDVLVTDIIRRIEGLQEMPICLFGTHRKRIHKAVKGLIVHIPKSEEK